MHKSTIITLLIAFVSLTGQATTIEEYHFRSGSAVLKGRILNKAEGEWSIVTVVTSNLFSDEEQVHAIPVAADGSFEGRIPLLHSQSVMIQDMGYVFLAVGDTLEVTKDALQEENEKGVTFSGHGMSAAVNRLWPGVKKHYFGDKDLFVKGLEREDIPAWKQRMVKLTDTVIADIEADRLPVPATTSASVKEVLGLSLLGDLLMAAMENYRFNMTSGGYYQINREELGDYYDFLAGRERWLTDNPSMLFAIDNPGTLFNYTWIYIMIDISFSPHEEGESSADYYRKASDVITSRYGFKNIGFLHQMALCRDVFRESNLDEDSDPNLLTDKFAAIIPLLNNPVVAHQALQRYRQYIKQPEVKAAATVSSTPEADALFLRIIEPYKGNTLLVHFWGMSCAPCRREMLDEREKVERLKDAPVRFLYICDEKDSPREHTEQWLTKNNIKGEHIYVTHNEWNLLAAKFNFYAIPFSIGVDKDGNVVDFDEVNKYVKEIQNE